MSPRQVTLPRETRKKYRILRSDASARDKEKYRIVRGFGECKRRRNILYVPSRDNIRIARTILIISPRDYFGLRRKLSHRIVDNEYNDKSSPTPRVRRRRVLQQDNHVFIRFFRAITNTPYSPPRLFPPDEKSTRPIPRNSKSLSSIRPQEFIRS